ncbi:histidine phosphatase family protein [Sutcliffiella horikoshii]|uniref:Histidine phosphatase family protein n=1 Tax=Sutcliffiella horikoshii TaxID=79883 RepID=A0A5D4SYR2_9BACI|nr:histidine phosphatase family protein [Sutcliffiella horikoshii]TYS67448.1 histidine phosphatase family protein [Sutcliffiella horikoshii]
MTNLYFIRHAHSTYTPDELERPLSEKGYKDAERILDLVQPDDIDVVVSSPYKRAVQTVEGVAQHYELEIEIFEALKERTLTTKPAEDFTAAITKVWEKPNFAWEGGESNMGAQARGVKVTHHLLEKYAGKNVAIGTHGNIMVLIMNYFDKQYDFSFWNSLDMPDIYKLTFDGNLLVEVSRLWER